MNQEEVILSLKSKLARDAKWAQRALLRIAKEQTADEFVQEKTRELNNRGFKVTDAFILTRMAQALERYGRLTEKQMALVQRKIPTYARQLVKLTGVDPIRKALAV